MSITELFPTTSKLVVTNENGPGFLFSCLSKIHFPTPDLGKRVQALTESYISETWYPAQVRDWSLQPTVPKTQLQQMRHVAIRRWYCSPTKVIVDQLKNFLHSKSKLRALNAT